MKATTVSLAAIALCALPLVVVAQIVGPSPPGPCDCPIVTHTRIENPPPACVSNWGLTVSNQVWGRCYHQNECLVPPLKCSADVRIEAKSKEGYQCHWKITVGGNTIFDEPEDPSLPAIHEADCRPHGSSCEPVNFWADGVLIGNVSVICWGCNLGEY